MDTLEEMAAKGRRKYGDRKKRMVSAYRDSIERQNENFTASAPERKRKYGTESLDQDKWLRNWTEAMKK